MTPLKNSIPLKWEIKTKFEDRNQKSTKIKDLINILLKNRGIKSKTINSFLNPNLKTVTAQSVSINKIQLNKTIQKIKKSIQLKEEIIVYGDYDVDGICGTAILWETLHSLGAKVSPYIPHRIDEGYGLSKKGILNVKQQFPNAKLIITVDNGIVANEAVDFANKQGLEVIIVDHHVPSKKTPNAYSIILTTKLCAAGVAWVLTQEVKAKIKSKVKHDHLELVALATIADLVPLLEENRTLTKFGLESLHETKRVGLLELFKDAGINKEEIGVYEVGHMIAPRLNAMGRLDYAMDSLRLLCTTDKKRAELLAEKLGLTNKERQELTMETALHASGLARDLYKTQKLLFVSHESYQPGVIGLVAGKLVEEYYRPAIVISKGEIYSKASARSIKGFNIIEFIRSASDLLIDAGGHPMAAGFTVETAKLALLENKFYKNAENLIDTSKLEKTLRIDCELPFSYLSQDLYDSIQKLAPFGMKNPEPVFASKVLIKDMRLVGAEGKHLKLKLKDPNSELVIHGIAFGQGEKSADFLVGDLAKIAYVIEQNEWNGNKKIELKIRDIRLL